MSEQQQETHRDLHVHERDLNVLAAVVVHRFASAAAEEQRIERVGALLAKAAELTRALHLQTRYTLVNHRGTPGTNDLAAASERLFTSLQNYASVLHELGQQYAEFAAAQALAAVEHD